MRRIAVATLLLWLWPAAASATGTVHCRARAADGPEIYFVVGRGTAAVIVQMNLRDRRGEFTTGLDESSPAIAQSWLDDEELKIDVVDANAERYVARLRTRRFGVGRYRGTLAYEGARHAMTCESEN